MAGLDKIIAQIEAEAQVQADSILAEAQEQARIILAEANQESAELCREMEEKSRTDAKNYQEKVNSSIEFRRRTQILQAKQEMIARVIDKAYQTLTSESTENYFHFIAKMAAKYALPKAGTIYFSQNDLSRIPTGFETVLQAAAQGNGGSLTLATEPYDIENGFVLVYGGVEENCTLRAIFDARKEQLQDKANELLFL